MSSAIFEYKIILLGSPGSGKSSFVNKHFCSLNKSDHIKSDYNISQSIFYNEYKRSVFNIWESSDQRSCDQKSNDKNPSDKNPCAYYKDVDAAIIMFDVTSIKSYRIAIMYYNSIKNKFSNIPIILCGNKIDLLKGKNNFKCNLTMNNIEYCGISVKNNTKIYEPFYYLSEKL